MSDTNIEYNDFGFTAMDADELASVDTKIVETTTTAKTVIDKLDKLLLPLLWNQTFFDYKIRKNTLWHPQII